MNFKEIAPKALTVANKQLFTASGVGDIVISVLNGDEVMKLWLMWVLFTPAIGFTLVSIGKVDDARYFMLFGVMTLGHNTSHSLSWRVISFLSIFST